MFVGTGCGISITWVAGFSGVTNCTVGKGIKLELISGWLVAALEKGEKLLMLPWFGKAFVALIAGAAVMTTINNATPRTISNALSHLITNMVRYYPTFEAACYP